MILAVLIFLITYLFLIWEKVPTAIPAALGATVMIVAGIIDQPAAIAKIDFNTLGLLTGMMIIVAILRKEGIFEYLAIKAVKLSGGKPTSILLALAIFTGVMSAFLDNVTTILIVLPITMAIADAFRISPMPFIITEIFFANIGGTATLIGDPPNILIGNGGNISFVAFMVHNLPVVLIIGLAVFMLLKIIYQKELAAGQVDAAEILANFDESKAINSPTTAKKAIAIFSLVLIGFVLNRLVHLELATVALGGAFLMLLVTKPHNIDEFLKEVEWPTLFFFMGLFILVGGLEVSGFVNFIALKLVSLTSSTTIMTILILWGTALLSSFLENVSFTATMISVIKSIGTVSSINLKPLWWALSLGVCLGGNATIIGAAANIVAASFARRNNFPIRFMDYLKIAFPMMILMVSIATLYIYFVDLY